MELIILPKVTILGLISAIILAGSLVAGFLTSSSQPILPPPLYEKHLKRIKKAGVRWVKIEAEEPWAIEFARTLGLDVIVVVETKEALKGKGWVCENYISEVHLFGIKLFGCDWGAIWTNYVKKKVQKFAPLGIKVWQVDNELNSPGQNFWPAVNLSLRKNIVRSGAKQIRALDAGALITTNLYGHQRQIESDIAAYRSLKEEGVPIDILGMDYYRGSWYPEGGPELYPADLIKHQSLWGGDVLIMETGFSAYPDTPQKRTEQANYVKAVFQNLDNFFKNVNWFKGIIWYEYNSPHLAPLEGFFGLHYERGLEQDKKPAWDEFVSQVKTYNQFSKFLGIHYHSK